MRHFEKFLLVIFLINAIGASLLGHWDSFFGWSSATLLQIRIMNLINF